MKQGPSSPVPVRRQMRRMSESLSGGILPPVPAPEPVLSAPDPGAKKAEPAQTVPPKRKASSPKKRQGPTRVSAEDGTTRSTSGDPTVKLISRATYEALLAKILMRKPFRQAAAYVHDWPREEPDELVIPSDRLVETFRGRVLDVRSIPRTPESRWNLHALADLEAMLDEADRWADLGEELPRDPSRSSASCLEGNRAMRVREFPEKLYGVTLQYAWEAASAA